MKTRVALVVTVCCCSAAAWLNVAVDRQKISEQHFTAQKQKQLLSEAEANAGDLKVELQKTSIALRQARETEEAARRERAESEVDVAHVRQELELMRTELAAISSAATPEQLAQAGKQIRDLQLRIEAGAEENKILKELVRKAERDKS